MAIEIGRGEIALGLKLDEGGALVSQVQEIGQRLGSAFQSRGIGEAGEVISGLVQEADRLNVKLGESAAAYTRAQRFLEEYRVELSLAQLELRRISEAQEEAKQAASRGVEGADEQVRQLAEEYRSTSETVRELTREIIEMEAAVSTVDQATSDVEQLAGAMQQLEEGVAATSEGAEELGDGVSQNTTTMNAGTLSAYRLASGISRLGEAFVSGDAVGTGMGIAVQELSIQMNNAALNAVKQNQAMAASGTAAATASRGIGLLGTSVLAAVGGVGLLVAGLSAGVAWFQGWRRGAEDAKQATEEWARAIAQGESEAETLVSDELLEKFPDLIEHIDNSSVSLESFVQALISGSPELDVYIDQLRAAADALFDEDTALNNLDPRLRANNNTRKDQINSLKTLADFLDETNSKRKESEAIAEALADAERNLTEELGKTASLSQAVALGLVSQRDAALLLEGKLSSVSQTIGLLANNNSDLLGTLRALAVGIPDDEVEVFLQKLRETIGLGDEGEAALRLLEAAWAALPDDIDDSTRAIEDFIAAERSAVDSGFALIDAVDRLSEIIIDVNENGWNPDNALDYAEALQRVQRIAADSPESLDALAQSLKANRDAGLISAEAYLILLNILAAVGGVSDAAAGGFATVESAIRSEGAAAGAAIAPNAQLVQVLGAVANATGIVARQVAAYLEGMSRALKTLGFFVPIAGAVGDALARAAGFLRGLSGGLGDLGGAIDLAGGALGNLGGAAGSAGGAAGGAADEARTKWEQFLDVLEEAFATINASLGLISSERGFLSAQDNLNDLRIELDTLLDRRNKLIIALEREFELSAQITANEQVRIENAEQNLRDAELAFAQGFISAAELELAKQELARAQEEAFAPTPEVEAIESELEAIEDRLNVLPDLIEEAELSIVSSALGMITAIIGFQDAVSAMSDDAIENFRRIAEEIGLTQSLINDIIGLTEQASGIGGLVSSVSGGGSTSGGTSGQEYVVVSGDTLNAIAARFGTTLADILAKNPYLDTAARNYGNLIFPGDVIKLFHGGILAPGQRGVLESTMPEIVGPASVLGVNRTKELLSGVGTTVQATVNISVAYPVDKFEQRKITEAIRDAIVGLERETL